MNPPNPLTDPQQADGATRPDGVAVPGSKPIRLLSIVAGVLVLVMAGTLLIQTRTMQRLVINEEGLAEELRARGVGCSFYPPESTFEKYLKEHRLLPGNLISTVSEVLKTDAENLKLVCRCRDLNHLYLQRMKITPEIAQALLKVKCRHLVLQTCVIDPSFGNVIQHGNVSMFIFVRTEVDAIRPQIDALPKDWITEKPALVYIKTPRLHGPSLSPAEMQQYGRP